MGLAVSEMRKGMTILYNGELFDIIEYSHSKRGRGGAIARTRLRNLSTDRVITATFKGSEDTKSVFLESKPVQYLYKDGDRLIFMNTESFEQFPVDDDILGDSAAFIVEGVDAVGYFYNSQLVKVEPPNFVEQEVVHTEPVVKGNTVSSVEKPATLKSGAVVQVPGFVKEGDMLKIDIRTGTYVERV